MFTVQRGLTITECGREKQRDHKARIGDIGWGDGGQKEVITAQPLGVPM